MISEARTDRRNRTSQTCSPWSVLLIGGNSGAGKTTIANAIGRRLGVNVAQADSYRLLAERASAGSGIVRSPDSGDSAEHHYMMLRRRATTLHPLLEIVTAFHVATRSPLILEGDCLLPSFAVQRLHAYVPVARSLRAIFVLDSDALSLHRKQLTRGRGFTLLSTERQAAQVEGDVRYAAWLRDEATSVECAVLDVGHETSVEDCVTQIIGQLQLDTGHAIGGQAAAPQ